MRSAAACNSLLKQVPSVCSRCSKRESGRLLIGMIKQHLVTALSVIKSLLIENVSDKKLKMVLAKRQRLQWGKTITMVTGSRAFPFLFSFIDSLSWTANHSDLSHWLQPKSQEQWPSSADSAGHTATIMAADAHWRSRNCLNVDVVCRGP